VDESPFQQAPLTPVSILGGGHINPYITPYTPKLATKKKSWAGLLPYTSGYHNHTKESNTMDFAAQYAFAGTHQAFPATFMPLTPSHSQSAGSEEFSNTSPPVSL
jgi:hypothetical protein